MGLGVGMSFMFYVQKLYFTTCVCVLARIQGTIHNVFYFLYL